MSGHHKFSELTKDFSPERKRRIKAEAAKMLAKMDREIHIEPIVLEWSEWHSWQDIERDARQDGVAVPNGQPGVYEVRFRNQRDRLVIGRSSDLRMRIKQGLVRGKTPHSAGEKIRTDMKHCQLKSSDVSIRWAVTNRPAAAEEELRLRHKARFGGLPKYNGFTR